MRSIFPTAKNRLRTCVSQDSQPPPWPCTTIQVHQVEKKVESRVELFSLTTGRRTAEVSFPFDCTLMAYSGSGKLVAMRLSRDRERIDVWNCDDRSHVCGFRPYPDRKDLAAAVFADDEHLLTLSDKQTLTMWKLPECKALYQIEDVKGPGISPTGQYLAIRSKNIYALMNARTGEPVGRLVADDGITAAAFHPKGHRFAAVSQVGGLFETRYADLRVWDMESGEIIAHIPLHAAGGSIHWCGEDHVLVDNTLLVDVKQGVPQWTYVPQGQRYSRNAVHCMMPPDDRHWYVAMPDRRRGGDLKLIAMPMPGRNETAPPGTTLESLLALKPGGTVSLNMTLPQQVLNSEIATQIRAQIVAELGRNKIRVDDSARTVLQLYVEERATGQRDTYVFGNSPFMSPFFSRRPREGEKTQTAQSYRVTCVTRFMRDNQTLWESIRAYGIPTT